MAQGTCDQHSAKPTHWYWLNASLGRVALTDWGALQPSSLSPLDSLSCPLLNRFVVVQSYIDVFSFDGFAAQSAVMLSLSLLFYHCQLSSSLPLSKTIPSRNLLCPLHVPRDARFKPPPAHPRRTRMRFSKVQGRLSQDGPNVTASRRHAVPAGTGYPA